MVVCYITIRVEPSLIAPASAAATAGVRRPYPVRGDGEGSAAVLRDRVLPVSGLAVDARQRVHVAAAVGARHRAGHRADRPRLAPHHPSDTG